jgi:hypothetical protein
MFTIILVLGFGAIAIIAFIGAISEISPNDGKCRIGLPRFVTIPLLVFDVFINTLLTIIFVYFLGPVVRSNNSSKSAAPISGLVTSLGHCCDPERSRSIAFHTGNPRVAKRINYLLWRTLIGTCLVIIPTVTNMLQSMILKGQELGFLCLVACNCDGRSSRYIISSC